MAETYQKIETQLVGKVGIITLNAPPDNGVGITMIQEILAVLEQWKTDDCVRTVMFQSALPFFSMGGSGDDLIREMEKETPHSQQCYTQLGGILTQTVASYPKSTLSAATGIVRGGATVLFNACDIRIAGESLRLKDSDMYYGLLASWGMSSLRLPLWIGRNKLMDYMFLCEEYTGHQAYELGLVSKVVPDDLVNEIGLLIATKMSKAAPIAVQYFKECVDKVLNPHLEEAREFELRAASLVYRTKDAKIGVKNSIVVKFIFDEFTGK